MHWIQDLLILKGESIELLPMTEVHLPELEKLAGDKEIWEFYLADGSSSKRFRELMGIALSEKEKGTQFPFVIRHNALKKIIGSTRFLDIQPQHRKLEIGWTWLAPAYWGTGVNNEAKLLLLTYCFEQLKTMRVQFKTHEDNIRSRSALLKIGARYEGTLRNDILQDNGKWRNSAYFSIIDTEWEEVKLKLQKLLDTKKY